jgi:hypothetical protein
MIDVSIKGCLRVANCFDLFRPEALLFPAVIASSRNGGRRTSAIHHPDCVTNVIRDWFRESVVPDWGR